MAFTQVQQDRTAYLVDGTQRFQVIASAVAAGDLPSTAIFVLEIIDPNIPKSDEFARVATIADLTDLVVDRPTAVLAIADGTNTTAFFRTSTHTFDYAGLDEAHAAQDTLKKNIDELVSVWQTYNTAFVTTGEVTDHPRAQTDVFTASVDVYRDALAAESVAKKTMDDAKADHTDAVTNAETAATNVTDTQQAYDDCVESKGWFDALYAAMAGSGGFVTQAGSYAGVTQAKAQLTAAQTFISAATGTPPTSSEKTTFQTAVNTFTAQTNTFETQDIAQALTHLGTAGVNQTAFTSRCATYEASKNTAISAKATADETVGNKQTTYIDAKAVYTAAQQMSEASLATLRALDPEWDPASMTCACS